ncbi:hypothetical protein [Microbulbifer aggregans]|uniref:hypothetical protein n=1 Tax=Microbulbifer aggregans TaxID=1769779 RepID=UPI001CFC7F11|nr:hypothetical protein [Microbulbifer aggregans]
MVEFINKMITRQSFERFVSVFLGKELTSGGGLTKHHIDALEINEDILQVRGWAFNLGKKFSPDLIYFRAGENYMISSCALKRPDVKRVFDLNSEMVGFHLKIKSSDVEKSELKIGFVSENSMSEFLLMKEV